MAVVDVHAAGAAYPGAEDGARTTLANVFLAPAYNEEANILRLLADLERHPSLFPEGSRVLIVDDGSADATAELVEAYSGPLDVELLRMGKNQGPGAAFRAGFRHVLATVEGEALIVTLEADTTSDLETLPIMLDRAAEGADLVLASVHGGGQMVNVSALRVTLSRICGVATRRALGLDARTVSSFFRVYRASTLRAGFARYGDDLIRERGFACKAEILAHLVAIGATVEEVPVDLDGSRRIGQSKMRLLPTLAAYGRLFARRVVAREEGSL